DSRYVRIGVTITSPSKCVFKTVVTTEYSKGERKGSFGDATSEAATLDCNKGRRVDVEDGDSPKVAIAVTDGRCDQGAWQHTVKIEISAPRQEARARTMESKRRAIDFIKKACRGTPRWAGSFGEAPPPKHDPLPLRMCAPSDSAWSLQHKSRACVVLSAPSLPSCRRGRSADRYPCRRARNLGASHWRGGAARAGSLPFPAPPP